MSNGVKVPFVRRRASPDRYVVKVDEVNHNVQIDDAEFEMPGNSLTQKFRGVLTRNLRGPLRRLLR